MITPKGGTILSKVEELIYPHTGQWGVELLRDNFLPVDVARILQIPLHVEAVEDFVAWHFTRSGTFSVRSAYHVEFNHQFGRQFGRWDTPGGSRINLVWKQLWQLRVAGKIKHFGWKVLKGVLPCFGVLDGRHIPIIPQCPFCRIGLEDIHHCIFTCSRAMEVWNELQMEDIVQKAVVQDRSGSITLEILLQSDFVIHEIPAA